MRRVTVLVALAIGLLGAVQAPPVGAGGQQETTWPDPGDAEIRPGVSIVGHPNPAVENACTANFVFSDTEGEELYIGSAAHCFRGTEVGTSVTIAGIEAAGELAYCGYGPSDVAHCPQECETVVVVPFCSSADGLDVALVQIDEAYHDEVHPAMLGYGGPDGVDEDVTTGEKVLTFGNSPARDAAGDRLDAREGYVTQTGEWWFRAYFAGPGVHGDSGSPVVTADGGAGIMVTLGLVPPGDNGVVALDAALEHLDEAEAVDVELETWPDTEEGLLP